MIRFLADEDFDNDIIRGLFRRCPEIDLVRVQDVSLSGKNDQVVLEWATKENRVLLTHDVSTMTMHVYARLASGLLSPGVFAVSQSLPIGQVLDDIILLWECSLEGEWNGQVRYLPL